MAWAILRARFMFGPCVKNNLVAPSLARAGMACLLAVGLALAGCGSNPDRDRPENPFKKQAGPGDAKAPLSDAELHVEADQLYRRAHESVVSSDWTQAGDRLGKLIARYPFSDYATQAEMEKIYVGYKGGQPDEAISNADRFLRAHPRSVQAEYVQYIKGVINMSRDEGLLETLGINSSPRKDVSNARRAYDDFALLVQRYPNSKYCGDARRRMIYLRDRIADHDLTVAQYYFRRGAFIAAARRAQSVVTEYPGAPSTISALAIIEQSYRKAGLNEQADDAKQILAANVANKPFTESRPSTVATTLPAAYTPAASAAAPPPAPAVVAEPTVQTKPTLIERFTHLFDVFDTSKPEHQYTVVLPSTHGDAPAAASSVPASPAPQASGVAPVTTVPATATTVAKPADDSNSHGLKMSIGAPQADPADATTSPTTSAPPANKP